MGCEICGKQIDPERLEVLPMTTRCVAHANATKRIGLMDFSHKTAPVLVLLDPNDKESVRRAKRVFHRSR